MNSGNPEFVLGQKLSLVEKEILEIVLQNWPVSALEIAEHLKEEVSPDNRKNLSTKYSYYLKKLVDKKLIFSKRVGNALIVWPLKVEKYRTIDQILQEDPDA